MAPESEGEAPCAPLAAGARAGLREMAPRIPRGIGAGLQFAGARPAPWAPRIGRTECVRLFTPREGDGGGA